MTPKAGDPAEVPGSAEFYEALRLLVLATREMRRNYDPADRHALAIGIQFLVPLWAALGEVMQANWLANLDDEEKGILRIATETMAENVDLIALGEAMRRELGGR